MCSAVMVDSGSSTARNTAITTISIIVVLQPITAQHSHHQPIRAHLLASLCLRSLASLLVNPKMDSRLRNEQNLMWELPSVATLPDGNSS